MLKIALIGAGQLGSRHLQGLAKAEIPISITVMDPSPASIDMSKERFLQIPQPKKDKQAAFVTSIENLPDNIDLVILATTAHVRADITRELIGKKKVQSILFEKIVFQTEKDFIDIIERLGKQGIKAWVNCPRRIYPFYQALRNLLPLGDKISYVMQGGQWDLACNAIHFIDLAAFFSGDHEIQLEASGLDREIIESKRNGFLELTGTLRGRFSNGSEFSVHSRRNSLAPHISGILGSAMEVIIDEGRGIAFQAKKDNAWKWEEVKFTVPYQSDLTGTVAKDILTTGSCSLPTLEQSSKLHRPFLKTILEHIERSTGKHFSACPIT